MRVEDVGEHGLAALGTRNMGALGTDIEVLGGFLGGVEREDRGVVCARRESRLDRPLFGGLLCCQWSWSDRRHGCCQAISP